LQADPGESGELLFFIDPDGQKEPGRFFQGYYGNKAATDRKIVRNVLTKGDNFFRTGDIIRIEHDGGRQYTHFEDRIGDTFRWKGENVSTMVLRKSRWF
jgi:acyl-CoA synthetase (AMP-forming)/AMP-acid ligase II